MSATHPTAARIRAIRTKLRREHRERLDALGALPRLPSAVTVIREGPLTHRLGPDALRYFEPARVTHPPQLVSEPITTKKRA